MRIERHADARAAGAAAAREGAAILREVLAEPGPATVVLATGVSQFPMLEALVRAPGIDWSRVTAFHLDEYIGLPADHPASFRRYLRERFVAHLPTLGGFVPILGDAPDPAEEAARLDDLIADRRVDVCFAGIGENGHLAFNDPPADFASEHPYLVVELDEACRRQQLGEGWFPDLAAVPRRAISMSIRQILRARRLVLAVPEARKARAVRAALEGPITPAVPASILQRHRDATLHLDTASAALLSP